MLLKRTGWGKMVVLGGMFFGMLVGGADACKVLTGVELIKTK